MMAADHDLNNEDIRKQVGESINKIRTFLEKNHIVKPGRMLDPADRSTLTAIQCLQKEYADLGQFTNLVIYTANEKHRTNETESLWQKTTIPLGGKGNKPLYIHYNEIHYDEDIQVGDYYVLTPMNSAESDIRLSQDKHSSQSETLPKPETSSSSNAPQSNDYILHDPAVNWYLEEESSGWCSIQ